MCWEYTDKWFRNYPIEGEWLPLGIVLIPARPDDTAFLFQVYAGTRRDEVAGWGWDAAQQAVFLQMQFEMQQRAYALQFPGAVAYIIGHQGQRVGRLILFQTERTTRIVDIAVLPEWRNHGVGSGVLSAIQREAAVAGRSLCLSVRADNPAQRLYQRLGFVVTGETETGCSMEWRATATQLVSGRRESDE